MTILAPLTLHFSLLDHGDGHHRLPIYLSHNNALTYR